MNLFATPKETGKHWEIWNSKGENLISPLPIETEQDSLNRLMVGFLARALSKAEMDVTRCVVITTFDNGYRHAAVRASYDRGVMPKPEDRVGLKDF